MSNIDEKCKLECLRKAETHKIMIELEKLRPQEIKEIYMKAYGDALEYAYNCIKIIEPKFLKHFKKP